MILLLGGTSDAREIACSLCSAGHEVLLTVVTPYGAEVAGEEMPVRVGALDSEEFMRLLDDARMVVDATHPFAADVSRMAIELTAQQGIPYLRFERPASALPANVAVIDTAEEAANQATKIAAGGVIFLTVGSKTLPIYVDAARKAGCRVVARVLPTAKVLSACEALGLSPAEIIAMRGPVSAEVEASLLRHYEAAVLVTKESGAAGGVPEKLRAAAEVGIPAIVVGRPTISYPLVVSAVGEVCARVAEVLHDAG